MAKSALTPELLGQPARLIARELGRHLLFRVLEVAPRLAILAGAPKPVAVSGSVPTDEDPEAVHDFRVAMRRLRSWLQACRPLLDDTVTRSSEQALRRLSRVAGQARDLQVQRGLLIELGRSGSGAAAVEARRIAARLVEEEFRARQTLVRALVRNLPDAAARLAGQLQRGALAAVRRGAEPTMAAAMAHLLTKRLAQLERALRGLTRTGRVEPFHEARIAVKRLRYLLEAFGSSSRLAGRAVLRLTALQDEFGRLHDLQILSQRAGREAAGPALRARLRRDVQTAFGRAWRLSRSRDVTAAR